MRIFLRVIIFDVVAEVWRDLKGINAKRTPKELNVRIGGV